MTEGFVSAFFLAGVIALSSYRFRLLTRGGALAQWALGFLLFGFGGWQWTLPIFMFFLSSTLLARIPSPRRRNAERLYAKGSRRDAFQVLANGGIAGLLVCGSAFDQSRVWFLSYLAMVGAATADTWGTELGVLSSSLPRTLMTLQPVERGISGGVTWAGVVAGGAGAMLIYAVGAAWIPGELRVHDAGIVLLSSVGGSLVDSLLGGTIQAQYRCIKCELRTERKEHCGKSSDLIRGFGWMNNDVVNLVCTLSASLVPFVVLNQN